MNSNYPKDQERVLVFGLPGAGKTFWITEEIKKHPTYLRVSGGSLIQSNIEEQSRDTLRKLPPKEIISNQNILEKAFQKACNDNQSKNIFFDGHLFLANDGNNVKVPLKTFENMCPTKFIFLDTDIEQIIIRRATDSQRPDREQASAKQLEKYRTEQLSYFKEVADNLKIPYEIISLN